MADVFICYAHADDAVAKQVEKHINPLLIGSGISTWRDQKIEAGDAWKRAILKKLESAIAFILIVSPDFLSSDFITQVEIPQILRRHFADGAPVFIVFAQSSVVAERPFPHPFEPDKKVKLTDLQGLNDPVAPIAALSVAEQNRVLATAFSAVRDRILNAGSAKGAAADPLASGDLVQDVRALLSAERPPSSTFDISPSWRELATPNAQRYVARIPELIDALSKRVISCRAFALVGPSASGKSTLLKQIAAHIATSDAPDMPAYYIDFRMVTNGVRPRLAQLVEQVQLLNKGPVLFAFDNVQYVLSTFRAGRTTAIRLMQIKS